VAEAAVVLKASNHRADTVWRRCEGGEKVEKKGQAQETRLEQKNHKLYLDAEALNHLIAPAVLSKTVLQIHGQNASQIVLPPKVALDRNLQALSWFIKQADQRALDKTTLKFLVNAVAAHVVHTHATRSEPKTSAPSPPRLSRRKIQQIEDYIQAHLAGSIKVEDIAWHVGMSRARFVERFKATTGATPHRFVVDARVRSAKTLLADSRLNLGEIAARTGFASPSHFASVFQRRVKISPSVYRMQVSATGTRVQNSAQVHGPPPQPPRLAAIPASALTPETAAPGLMEFQLEQTSLPLGSKVRLLKSSQGLGWTDMFAAVTDELPHEGLRGAIPAVWIVTSSAPNNIQRFGCEGKHDLILPQRAISVTGAGQAVYDELGLQLQARHLYLRQSLIDEVADEIFAGSQQRRFIGSSLGRTDPILYRLMTVIRAALDEPPLGNRLKMDYLSQALAAHLLARYSIAGSPRPLPVHTLNARQIGRLSDYVNDNLASEMSIIQLAEIVGLSRAQFIQRFKATALMPPHRFVILRRINQARKLLARPGADLALIALTCGFADQSHFTAVFRRVVGVTPGEYLRMMA
jgi:AraC-like DNA-binding protein